MTFYEQTASSSVSKPVGAGGACHGMAPTDFGTSVKGTFLLESTDIFVITPNRQTFFFPETEKLNFGDF